MHRLGNCGGEIPGADGPDGNRLRLYVGPDVTRCPVATAYDDGEIIHLASLVAGPYDDGLLSGIPRHMMPPKYRDLCEQADGWAVRGRAELRKSRKTQVKHA